MGRKIFVLFLMAFLIATLVAIQPVVSGDDTPALTAEDFAGAKNLLDNGDFEKGKIRWSFQTHDPASAKFDIDSKTMISGKRSAKFTIGAGGTEGWHVEIFNLFPMQQGKSYMLSFLAKAAAERPMKVLVQQDQSPYTVYYEQTFDLSTEAQTFTFFWTAEQADLNTRLNLGMGGHTVDVWIDDVQVLRKD